MSAGDLALYGAAALGAAEYVGVTDFFGGDEQGTLGDGGLPPAIAAALAAAGGRGGGAAGEALDLAVNAGRQVPTGTGASTGTIADQVVENINDTRGGGGPTTVPTGVNSRTGGDGVNTSNGDFELTDLAGTSRLGTGIATTAKAADNTGSLLGEAGEFVSQNPYATGGAALGLLAAPFTGGASVPVAAAAAGGTAEIGADLITGQRGNPLEGGLGPVDSAISGTKETVAGGLTGDEDTSVVGGGITGDPDTSVFGGGSSSSSSGETSNQTATKDERTEAARDQDSGGGGIGPEIGGVPAIGPAFTGGGSSSSSSTDVPTSSDDDDGGLVGGGFTGDEDTSVVGGGITGDEDTSVVGGGITGDPNTSVFGGGSSGGGGSGTDEDAEKDKKEDSGGWGGITGDSDTSVFGGGSSDDEDEDKDSSSGPGGLGGLTGLAP